MSLVLINSFYKFLQLDILFHLYPFTTTILPSGKNSVYSLITLHLTFYSRFNIVFFVISFYITLYTMVVTQQSHRKNFSTFFIFCEKNPSELFVPWGLVFAFASKLSQYSVARSALHQHIHFAIFVRIPSSAKFR